MTATDRTQWLAGLKAGDEVAIRIQHGSGAPQLQIRGVQRATKTQIGASGYTFRRDNGRLRSGERHSYTAITIEPPSDEIRGEIERARIAHVLRQCNWQAFPLSTLTHIAHVIEHPDSVLDAGIAVAVARRRDAWNHNEECTVSGLHEAMLAIGELLKVVKR